jgi:hypothetical protein
MSEQSTQAKARSEAEDHLLQMLQMVNEWLRFAETKNAGLVAVSGVGLVALLTYVADLKGFAWWEGGALFVGGVLWLFATLLATVSFLPRMDLLNVLSRVSGTPTDSDNLYYYAHLAQLEAETLLTALGIGSVPDGPRYRFEKDLANQVIANSRITNEKLELFQWATICWCIGLLIVAISVFSIGWG